MKRRQVDQRAALEDGFARAGDPRRWRVLWVVVTAQLLIVLDANIVNIALPSAQAALGMSDGDRQWVVTAYSLTFGGFLLLGGRVADLHGRRRIFLAGLAGFALASALAGLAQDPLSLLAGRAAQGLAGAFFAPAGLAMLTTSFTDAAERAKAFSVFGAAVGTGGVAGMIFGGVITEYASWRWCLLINVPVVAILLVAAVRVLRESRSSGPKGYDLPGALTATLGIGALIYAVSRAEARGWAHLEPLGFGGAGAALLAAFVVIEHRSAHPMMPLRVIAHRVRGSGHTINFVAGGALYAAYLFLTYYLQGVKHYSALQAGLAFIPMAAGILIGALGTGRLPARLTPRTVLIAGLALGALGMAGLATIDAHSGYAVLLVTQLVIGTGVGAALTTIVSLTMHDVPPDDSGVAGALTNATQQIGGAVGISLLNVLALTVTGTAADPRSADALTSGYNAAFLTGAGLLAAAALIAWTALRGSRAGRRTARPRTSM
ncbi:MFS transporter [Streptosporangium roseum]|uniref:MFS transporter n=1 Tax=Streptosporangium roseum TaxID=2001 RepID=UPI00332E80B0